MYLGAGLVVICTVRRFSLLHLAKPDAQLTDLGEYEDWLSAFLASQRYQRFDIALLDNTVGAF
jgi:hypothetical protein